MMTRTIGGWALLANAAISVVLFIAMSDAVGREAFYQVCGDTVYQVIGEVLSITLVVGLGAMWTVLPRTRRLGRVGQIGLWCLGISTAIAFVVRLALFFTTINLGDVVGFSSAAIGLVGCLLVGWVTIRMQVFHPLIGWLLIVSGVLNLVGGLLPAGVGASVMGVIGMLASVGAFGGYGWTLVRRADGAATRRAASVESR